MSMIESLRARARLLFGRRAAEARMTEEMRFHVEMEAERLMRDERLAPAEARRRARIAFGGVEKYREEMRDGRTLAWIPGLMLDLKLGARTAARSPVLALAGALAMALAVALAASWFEFMGDLLNPRLPLPQGDRIVSMANWDAATGETETRSLHDFESWRAELKSVEDLMAGAKVTYGASTQDRRVATLDGMRVTASAFRLARVAPLLGRPLTAADEEPGAPLVAVLGHAAWMRLYDGSPAAVGQTLRLGAQQATVVGVMPEGFAFPVDEEIWTPLRDRALAFARREGPEIGIAGRLAPGYTLEEAQAELTQVSRRTAAAFPATHEKLTARMKRFGSAADMRLPATLINIPFVLFLVVVCANVSTLHFARVAAREGEIAVRTALGASRRRLILQLVMEALVLTAVAAALGLAMAAWGLRWGMALFWEVQQMRPPFWFDAGLSPLTAVYACALALLAAVVVGGVPALRATGKGIRHRLTQPGAGGSGMRFGAVATGVIVVQVALCVAFLPYAVLQGRALLKDNVGSDFPADRFLSARLTFETPAGVGAGPGERAGKGGGNAEAARLFVEVQRRLAAEAGVVAATRASQLPGINHRVQVVQVEGDTARLLETRAVAVEDNFFEVMGARAVAGRAFRPDDAAGAEVAVAAVDRGWAAENLPGASPVGRRVRFPGPGDEAPGRWIEIVGVIGGMERAVGPGDRVGLYLPLRPGDHASTQLYLRASGAPEELAPRVQTVVAGVDPRIVVSSLLPLDEVWRPVERSQIFLASALTLVSAVILLFALLGIYALVSFTVAQRSREIGIRVALGADRRRILVAIFSRAAWQIGCGVLLGAALVAVSMTDEPGGLRLVAGVAALMVAVGLVGCILPALRALRIQPSEALRTE